MAQPVLSRLAFLALLAGAASACEGDTGEGSMPNGAPPANSGLPAVDAVATPGVAGPNGVATPGVAAPPEAATPNNSVGPQPQGVPAAPGVAVTPNGEVPLNPPMQGAPPGAPAAPVAQPVVPHTDQCAQALAAAPAQPPETAMRRLSWTEFTNAVTDIFAGVDGGAFATEAEVELIPDRVPERLLTNESFYRAFRPAAADIAARAASGVLANACAGADPACLEQELLRAARLAWRSNLEGPERELLTTRLAEFIAELGAEEGYANALQIVLASPRFAYVLEPGSLAADQSADGVHRATGTRAAGMLAAALWASVPDAPLLDAAAGGDLDDSANLQQQVGLMMADPRARRGLATFFRSWLGYRQVEKTFKDNETFPQFSDSVRSEMVADTEETLLALFFDEGGDPNAVATSPLGFPGTDTIDALDWQGVNAGRADLSSVQRHGVATHPAVLAMNAGSGDTSIINRGLFVVETLACNHIPPPPPDVDADLDKLIKAADRPLSNREIAEMHSVTPDCAGCHAFIDPFGIVFENYDAIGGLRDTDRGGAIDTSVNINGPLGLNGSFAGAPELLDALTQSGVVRECFAEQFAQFIKPLELSPSQRCALSSHTVGADDKNATMSEIVQRFLSSEAFLHRTL